MAVKAWLGGTVAWALLLTAGAYVQLNDPDPFVWVAAYLIAAAMSVAAGLLRLDPRVAAGWAAVMLAWAGWIALGGIPESNPMAGPAGIFEDGLLAEEVVRESLGLALIAVGLLVQAGGVAYLRRSTDRLG